MTQAHYRILEVAKGEFLLTYTAGFVGARVEAGVSVLPCPADFVQKGLHPGDFPPGLKEQLVTQ